MRPTRYPTHTHHHHYRHRPLQGLALPELRDEILLQLAKQLTGNPSLASAERGWVLLHAALATFPPSEELENFLELWLRERGAVPCVWAMHLTLYRGGPPRAAGNASPSAAELQAALERARAPPLPSLVVDLGGYGGGGNVVSHDDQQHGHHQSSSGGAADGGDDGSADFVGLQRGSRSGSTSGAQQGTAGGRNTRVQSSAAPVAGPNSVQRSGNMNGSSNSAARKSSAASVNAPPQQRGGTFHDDIEAQMEAIARKFFPQGTR